MLSTGSNFPLSNCTGCVWMPGFLLEFMGTGSGAQKRKESSRAQVYPPKDARKHAHVSFTRENRKNPMSSCTAMESQPEIGNECSNQSSFKDGKTPGEGGGDAPTSAGHSRIHLSRDLTAEEKSHVAEMRYLL
jgi:hypothetical protein